MQFIEQQKNVEFNISTIHLSFHVWQLLHNTSVLTISYPVRIDSFFIHRRKVTTFDSNQLLILARSKCNAQLLY